MKQKNQGKSCLTEFCQAVFFHCSYRSIKCRQQPGMCKEAAKIFGSLPYKMHVEQPEASGI
jgi:hypothetical protein